MLGSIGGRVVPDELEHEALATPQKVTDVGRYRLVAELARGGMGIVYLALVRGPGGFNKLFVLKILKDHLAEDPKLVFMFLEEARLAAKLSHPNVVQTIEVGSDGRRHYIAMEYLDGQSLYRVLARARRNDAPMPLAYQLYVLSQLLEGLQYAHGVTDFDGTTLNLVHRDVSPGNVFLTYDGLVKVLDFGIAKALDSTNDTRTGMLKGKIAYMAPEQAAGEPIDRRTDVFSAGVMLWEAAVGRRMWDRSMNDLQILHALVNGRFPRPREVNPEIDPGIERIVLRATELRPADRYTSATEMQADLDAYLKGLGAPPFGARDIGKFVSDLFADERTRLRGVLDAQLRLLKGISSGEYRKLELPQLGSSTNPHGTPSGVLRTVNALNAAAAEVEAAAEPDVDVEFQSGTLHAGPGKGRAAPRSTRFLAVALLLSIVGIAGVAAIVLLLRRPSSSSDARAVPATAAAQTASSPQAVETIPAATQAPAPPPTAATPPVGVAPVSIPPVAPGHNIWRRPVTHEASPPPAASAAPPAASAPAPPPPPPPPPVATATAHVRQQIDTSNPYGH
jgi:serine/threonine-protein kinase